jgi:phosphomethylpyrimidine synthase
MCVMYTLVQECLRGVPVVVEQAARAEGIAPRDLAENVARGRVVIPSNSNRRHRACAVGEGCCVKVNVNVGTSGERCDETLEIRKAEAAIRNGADTLMDLSTGGDLRKIREKILAFEVPVGTVPIYEAVRKAGNVADVDSDMLFNVIREHCKDGVDFLTLHCGVNFQALEALRADPRLMGVVSRGGAFHIAMMFQRGEENPLFKEYDYLLEILAETDVVISLGDGMRPGCLQDAGKRAKSVEYLTLGGLASRALDHGVQRMIEGPGHIPVNQIGYNVKMIKELTCNAPLYLLGPLVTDIGAGYDHVVSAIGGAIACKAGADFLCMVTPAEHLALPDVDDIVEGTRVARLAAHVGDMARRKDASVMRRESQMADARRRLDWEEQFKLCLFGDVARKIHERDGKLETCSMCGDLCAMKIVKDLLDQVPISKKPME